MFTNSNDIVRADARNRSLRTLAQGLAIDVFVAVVAVLAMVIPDLNVLDGAAWATLGVLLLKTVIQAVVSYLARLRFTPSVTIQDVQVGVNDLPAANGRG